jgi:hypothetical protein
VTRRNEHVRTERGTATRESVNAGMASHLISCREAGAAAFLRSGVCPDFGSSLGCWAQESRVDRRLFVLLQSLVLARGCVCVHHGLLG